MSHVSKGHDYEREVKAELVEHGWGCTRAASSNSPFDLIAYVHDDTPHISFSSIMIINHYTLKTNRAKSIPCLSVAVKKNRDNVRSTYYTILEDSDWTVVLMQQKIKKRRPKK